MLKKLKFLSVLLLLSTGSLMAYAHPCPGSWEVTADYLYLLPSVDDTYFVIDSPISTTFPNGERKNNDLGFHSGFRVGGLYSFCDCDREFRAYYTRLRTKECRTVTGDFLWATVGRPDFASNFENYEGDARSRNDLLYERVDGLWTQQALCCCGLNVYFQGGIEYAYLRLHEDYRFRVNNTRTSGTIDEKHRTWGVGPQFGLDFDWALCEFDSCWCPGSLSINAFTSGSILASKTRDRNHEIFNGATLLDVKSEHTWRLIPAFHTRVGLCYATSFCCFGASVEVGYEFNTYVRALARTSFVDDVADSLCVTDYYNFDVQGLYVSTSFTF